VVGLYLLITAFLHKAQRGERFRMVFCNVKKVKIKSLAYLRYPTLVL